MPADPAKVKEFVNSRLTALVEDLLAQHGVACVIVTGVSDGHGFATLSAGNMAACPMRDLVVQYLHETLEDLPQDTPLPAPN